MKQKIKQYIESRYSYDLSHTCDEIRPRYSFEESCQGAVPQAIIAFLDSTDFESCVRLAVSLGGDSDTLACIAAGIAEAYYKDIPKWIVEEIWKRLSERFVQILRLLHEKSHYREMAYIPSKKHSTNI